MLTESNGYFEKPNFKKQIPEYAKLTPIMTNEELIEKISKPNAFELVSLLLQQSDRMIKLIYFFLKIFGSAMFKDWKTTVIGIIGLLAYVVKTLFNIDVPAEVQTGFITVIVFLIGLFSKDSNK